MFDKAKADAAVKFYLHLKHTKGQWYGVPFELLEWQDEIVRDLFGTVKENGFRQYDTAYIEIPKKQGKSELAAGIGLKLTCADEEWAAEVYGAAADRGQASIVFDVAVHMVDQWPALKKKCKLLLATKRIVYKPTNSFYQVLSAEAYTKHGINAHGVIIDELHAQPNRELFDVLTHGSGDARRQPLFFFITTAGSDRESICWEVHEKARRILDKQIEDKSFYPVIFGANQEDDWSDEKIWHKVNPSLGVTIHIDKVRKAYKSAKENPAEENLFRRLRLNQWTSQETRYIPMDKWRACTGLVNEQKLKGKVCYASLDLSARSDFTTFVALFWEIRRNLLYYDVLPKFWLPEEAGRLLETKYNIPITRWKKEGLLKLTDGDVVDYRVVEHDIKAFCRGHDVQEIAFDPWNATMLTQNLDEEGIEMVEFRQGFASMSPPTKEILALILDKKLNHGGNPVLHWMADCMTVKQDPAGNVKPVKPDRHKSGKRIDGIVALIMALGRAMVQPDLRSCYDDRPAGEKVFSV